MTDLESPVGVKSSSSHGFSFHGEAPMPLQRAAVQDNSEREAGGRGAGSEIKHLLYKLRT